MGNLRSTTEQSTQKLRTLITACSLTLILIASALLAQTIFGYTALIHEDSDQVEAQFAPGDKSVLLICSYDPNHLNYSAEVASIDKVFYENNISYDIEYMYANQYSPKVSADKFHELLTYRLQHHKKYDLIMLADDDALNFGMKYQTELFDGIPMVFLGVNNQNLATLAMRRDDIAGVLEQNYIKETVELARKLIPNATNVVGIYDETTTGIGIAQTYYAVSHQFPDLQFYGLDSSGLTKEEFAKHIEDVGDDSILLYMVANNDRDGNVYNVPASAKFVVDHAKVPIFRNYSGGMGQGVLGGVRMNLEKNGEVASRMAVSILEGTDADDLEMYEGDLSQVVFDYSVLQKYHLDGSVLPDNTMMIGEPVSYWDEHRDIFVPAIMVLIALLGLLANERLLLATSRKNEIVLRTSAENLRQSKEELQFQVEHDYLTKLYNRQTAVEYLRRTLHADSKYAMVLIDVNNFKDINETFGHEFGDTVLISLSNRLHDLAEREACYIARYGGDEFLAMFPGHHLDEDSAVLQILAGMFQTPIQIGMEAILPNASVGVANSDGVSSPEQLILNADMAMYEAKKKGKNTISFFEQSMKESADELNEIKAKTLDAITNDGLYMVYQPKVSVTTKEVVGFEALVRMKDYKISPAVFVPIAEQNGWIRKVGRITTRKVIEQLAAWRDEGKPLRPVSVNFSSKQLNDTEYLPFVLDLLKQYDIPPYLIEIEITEGMFIERTQRSTELLQQFKQAGLQILMDDFGTGYSSLSYLSYIPVDVIKLDKSLVDSFLVEGKDSFIENIIHLTHDLGKMIVIEGVEDAWQYEKLKEYHGDVIQGYYFSKPLLPEDAVAFRVKK